MTMDVVELRDFYTSTLGKSAQNSISMALSSLWDDSSNEIFLGLGYPVPYLDRFSQDCERTLCMMPAAQGALHWPSQKSSATALIYDDELPLRDSSVDRVLMVHHLEHAESAEDCLNEAWRVLSPNGKLIIVTPNRRGIWTRFEHTPFGTGKPYSKRQLKKLLTDTKFTPETWSEALLFPPSKSPIMLKAHKNIERFGRRILPLISGVICISASKRLYQGVSVRATTRAKRRMIIPVLSPQGTTRVTDRGK